MEAVFAIVALSWQSMLFSPGPALDSTLVEEYSFGSFQYASRISIDQQSTIFILDRDHNTISSFHGSVDPERQIGGYGWSATTFDHPTGVASDGVNVYVSDYGNHRIQRFDRSFNYISSLVTRDTVVPDARFGYPLGIGLSGQGDLYVLDGENTRVVKFASTKTYSLAFGNRERESAQLRDPQKLLVSLSGTVYVEEPDRILAFDAFGNYLTTIGAGVCANLVGCCVTEEFVFAVSADQLWVFSTNGSMTGHYSISRLMTENKLGKLTDVAVYGDKLYLLCQDQVHVFRWMNR